MLDLLASLITVFPTKQAPPDMVTMQMVFFRVAPGKHPISKEKGKMIQADHVDKLKRLWEKGTAIIAGPIDDKSYVGLVLLNVKDEKAAKDLLSDDPYVQVGALTLDVIPWYFQNVFHKAPKFHDLEKIWFGILQRPKNAPQYSATKLEEMQKGHLANIGKMARDGILASAGPFDAKDDRRGIFIFFSKNIKQVRRAVAPDPLIRAKRLELKLMPWYTGKGTVVQYKSK